MSAPTQSPAAAREPLAAQTAAAGATAREPLAAQTAAAREPLAAQSNAADAVAELIVTERLLAIVRTPASDVALAAVAGLVAGGVKVAELALSHPGALAALARAADAHGEQITLGAGTILTVAQARDALAAGARFLVSPGFDPALQAFAQEQGVLHLPGVLTPSEVGAALAAGAPLLKLFPAGRLGPGYVGDLLAPFPQARLVATGGVDASNARAFLAAGAVAIAPGGALLPAAGAVALAPGGTLLPAPAAAAAPGGSAATAHAVAARATELNRLVKPEPSEEPRAH